MNPLEASSLIEDCLIKAEHIVREVWGNQLADHFTARPSNRMQSLSNLASIGTAIFRLTQSQDQWEKPLAAYHTQGPSGHQSAFVILQDLFYAMRELGLPRGEQIRELSQDSKEAAFENAKRLWDTVVQKQCPKLPTLQLLRETRIKIERERFWFRLEQLRTESEADGIVLDLPGELVTADQLAQMFIIPRTQKHPGRSTMVSPLKDLAPEKIVDGLKLYRKGAAVAHIKAVKQSWLYRA